MMTNTFLNFNDSNENNIDDTTCLLLNILPNLCSLSAGNI